MNFISEFFKDVLEYIYDFVGNYGWSVVLFTALIRVALLPLDIKSKKGMRAMAKVQPKMQALQKKYADDREKLNVKMQELYRKEKVSPLAGCLPLLLSLPILYLMFSAMRIAANEHTIQMILTMKETGEVPALQGWFWIKNVFQPDSFMSSILPTSINAIGSVGGSQWLTEENIAIARTYLASEEYSTLLAQFGANNFQIFRLNLLITTIDLDIPNSWAALFSSVNGYLILPILAGVSQYIMTKVTTARQAKKTTQNQPDTTNPAASTMNSGFMKWFFPLFSVWICASSTAAFSIYWMAANVIQIVEQVVVDYVLDKKEQREALNNPQGEV